MIYVFENSLGETQELTEEELQKLKDNMEDSCVLNIPSPETVGDPKYFFLKETK